MVAAGPLDRTCHRHLHCCTASTGSQSSAGYSLPLSAPPVHTRESHAKDKHLRTYVSSRSCRSCHLAFPPSLVGGRTSVPVPTRTHQLIFFLLVFWYPMVNGLAKCLLVELVPLMWKTYTRSRIRQRALRLYPCPFPFHSVRQAYPHLVCCIGEQGCVWPNNLLSRPVTHVPIHIFASRTCHTVFLVGLATYPRCSGTPLLCHPLLQDRRGQAIHRRFPKTATSHSPWWSHQCSPLSILDLLFFAVPHRRPQVADLLSPPLLPHRRVVGVGTVEGASCFPAETNHQRPAETVKLKPSAVSLFILLGGSNTPRAPI